MLSRENAMSRFAIVSIIAITVPAGLGLTAASFTSARQSRQQSRQAPPPVQQLLQAAPASHARGREGVFIPGSPANPPGFVAGPTMAWMQSTRAIPAARNRGK
jgi:hypothetical protein